MRYITRSARRRRPITFSLLLAFAVQSLVPFGYMPKAFADGGFIELCPQGISDEVMAVLHPEHHDGHETHSRGGHDGHTGPAATHMSMPVVGAIDSDNHHAHHQHHAKHSRHHGVSHQIETHDAHPDFSTQARHTSSWQNDCPFGLIASGADLAPSYDVVEEITYLTDYQPVLPLSRIVIARLQRKQQSRAPPIQPVS